MIPRVVHQIWVGIISPDEKQADQIADTKNKLQREGIDYVFWSNGNYPTGIPDNLIHYAHACRRHTTAEVNYGAFEADALRYYIMYQYGGVYLDCDYNIVRLLGDLMQGFDTRPVFARLWPHRKAWPCNGFLAAAPDHPLYRFIVASIKRPTSGKPYYIGPAWLGARLSEFLKEPLSNYNNDTLSIKGQIQMLDEGNFLLKHKRNPNGFLEHRAWYTWRRRSLSSG